MAAPITIFGSTGLTGSHVLKTMLATDHPVTTISRRSPAAASPTLNALVEPETSKWAAALSALSPTPAAVISAVGTTRAAAGGLAEQWKIDHDLNVELARAAKEAGVKTFVFVSSAGTRGAVASSAPYSKMKNGVEDAIKDLGFESAVILKPGTIMGPREKARTVEGLWQGIVNGIGRVAPGVKDALGQSAESIGAATAKAAQMAVEGKAPSKYWVIEAPEILKLGRDEAAKA